MRLKSIKLAGFKSFVDPTTVHFPGNMCAVVGPNGCGKSNIIDAVRWVMGESSAKTLRGESMTDVIFNGTTGRQPVSQASIELVFDNSEGKISGEFAAYTEISVRRVVTRAAQSEYYLNGAKCRRRDITDLFLGTGLGPRSYAIIEQGVVSRLIESRPEDLRVFIEEAAGISKYKERRKETESRMRRTKENLERLTDLRDELARNLSHLARQARAAEKYAELKQEEREVQGQLFAIQWRNLNTGKGEVSGQIGSLEVKREAANAELGHVASQIEQLRQDQVGATDAFNQAQEAFYSVGGEVTRVEQALRFAQERRGELKRNLEQTRVSLQQTQQHLEADRERLKGWEEELSQSEPGVLEHKRVSDELAASLAAAETDLVKWSESWDSFNERAQGPGQVAEVQQSRIAYLEQVLSRLGDRSRQLSGELEALIASDEEAEDSSAGKLIADADAAVVQRESELNTLQVTLAEQRAKVEEAREQQDGVRAEIQEIRGQISSLTALQEAAADDRERIALNDWLADEAVPSKGSVYASLQVEPGWESVVELILGDALSAALLETDALTRMGGLSKLPSGAFLVDEAAEVSQSIEGTLAAKVEGPARIRNWLSHVRIAADVREAKSLLDGLAEGDTVVTRDGHWLGAGWHRVHSVADPAAGMIERQSQLEQYQAELSQCKGRAEAMEQEIARLLEARNDIEKRVSQIQQALQVAVNERAELVAEHRAVQAKAEQMRQRQKRLQSEIEETKAHYAQEQNALAEARRLLAESLDQMEADRKQRDAMQAERTTLTASVNDLRVSARAAADVLLRTDLQVQSLSSQIATVKESIRRMESQLGDLQSREVELSATLPGEGDPDAEMKAELSTLLEQRVSAEADLTAQRTLLGDVEAKLREQEKARTERDQAVQAVQREIEALRLKETEVSVRLENLDTEIRKLEALPEELVAALPEDSNEEAWRQKVEQAAARITRLGPINLAAIDEHAQASERKQYLDMQNDDLESALETLQSAIRKIDKETRQRFKDTFDQINTGFAELFPRVFGGGTACLEMTGDDLLDTGVAIFARPPGKKNSTIHLLSGGEKAMTAIALVFSIFQLNPAPFCMLDEVDAPLDDANVGRYARLVREMSEKVQFVFITHNKITMEAADQLMGVTMQEPGVSRLVSVDVEEAAQLAAS